MMTNALIALKEKYARQIKKGAIRSIGVLEIINTDIYGSLSVKSIDDFYSFITLTNYYSRYGYIYHSKDRSDAIDKFKVFKTKAKNLHNRDKDCKNRS